MYFSALPDETNTDPITHFNNIASLICHHLKRQKLCVTEMLSFVNWLFQIAKYFLSVKVMD